MKNTLQHRNWISRMPLRVAGATLALVPVLALAVMTTQPALAQTFTSLVSFDGTNGANPYNTSLVQGTDGNLYGTTLSGGANEVGTVFKVTPAGTLTTLHSFAGYPTDGGSPWAGLVLGANGTFYGTTYGGGANNDGTVFSMTSEGVVTILHSFCSQTDCSDGSGPEAPLVQATNGNFYGTTEGGGANGRGGTVFEITPGGTLKTLYSFCSQADCTDGEFPEATLIQATNGNLYGTTSSGGASETYGGGTVFSITTGGTLKTVYNFCSVNGTEDCLDGYTPAALVQGTNGTFYGTTAGGGSNEAGTVFSLTSGGTLTTLYAFCSSGNCTNGENPYAGLIQATNGNFYGTTNIGGPSLSDPEDPCAVFESFTGCGTIFEISAGGALTTLHGFDGTDGFNYEGGNALFQATNGNFYGTTFGGGADAGGGFEGYGTIFSLDVGLHAFVSTLPTSGMVGTAVTILGSKLTGATSVTFNGTAATFTVVSSSEITTTVPTGATTGTVSVVTPSGTLKSNVKFRVT
jgi:uncharacterized repeat protein (TIGR03803 family)